MKIIPSAFNSATGDWYNGTYSVTAATSDTIWQHWNLTTATTQWLPNWDGAWRSWNVAYSSGTILCTTAEPTPEQVQRAQARMEKAKQAAVEVRERAEEILRAHLTPEQREELERLKRFTVRSPSGRLYRVWSGKGRHGNIEELTNEGAVIASLCCAPTGNIPEADALLGQKLFLELDEETFRKTANITRRAA